MLKLDPNQWRYLSAVSCPLALQLINPSVVADYVRRLSANEVLYQLPNGKQFILRRKPDENDPTAQSTKQLCSTAS